MLEAESVIVAIIIASIKTIFFMAVCVFKGSLLFSIIIFFFILQRYNIFSN